MRQIFLVFGFNVLFIVFNFAQNTKSEIVSAIENDGDQYWEIALKIWNNPELGYHEHESSELLQNKLLENDFEVKTGIAGAPTAFVASYGNSKPVIGIIAEFDALPGMSQKAIPEKEPVKIHEAGHGCGHHLFGTASVAAAIQVKQWMKENKIDGTIRVYGTPAEEGGGGKIYMLKAGVFEDVDAVLHWHPDSKNSANPETSLANKAVKFQFHGSSSHAAKNPDRGRSALDAVESMNFMVNMMREHVPSDSRIHYVITNGGEAPNVVPDFAEVYYYIRHPEKNEVKRIFEWIMDAANGAAKGTRTSIKYKEINGLYNILPNKTLSKLMYKNLSWVGGYTYTQEEQAFALEIFKTYAGKYDVEDASIIQPFEEDVLGTFSTDVGDVSWNVPTTGLRTATWVPGTVAHSWQAVAAGGTTIGYKGMLVAAKTLAVTTVDLINQPNILLQAKEEIIQKRGRDFLYIPLISNEKPPLDYMQKHDEH